MKLLLFAIHLKLPFCCLLILHSYKLLGLVAESTARLASYDITITLQTITCKRYITEKECCAVSLCSLVLSDMSYLRELREKQDLSIEQLAYRAKMHELILTRLESGHIAVSESFAKRLAKYYKMDWRELYGCA